MWSSFLVVVPSFLFSVVVAGRGTSRVFSITATRRPFGVPLNHPYNAT